MGLAVPRAVAAPVLPVLVALAWEEASPLKPLKAVGVTVRFDAAPAPPLAAPVTTEQPPAARGGAQGGPGEDEVEGRAAGAGDAVDHAAVAAVAGRRPGRR